MIFNSSDCKKYYLKSITKNEYTKWLQQALKTLEYSIIIDGSYGSATEKVVKEFQKKNNLTQGVCTGLDTNTKIINALK